MSYSISVKRPKGRAYYQVSHNILVKQPKSYAYYNGGQAWQIDLPKIVTIDSQPPLEAVVRSKTESLSSTARLGARLEESQSRPLPISSTARLGARMEGSQSRPSPTRQLENKELIMLRLPARLKGKTITAAEVVQEVLLQHYGLDLRHANTSQWLERYAPDVKYAIAVSRLASSKGTGKLKFKVAPNGTVQVQVSTEVDRRLREVSVRYRQTRPEPNLFDLVQAWVVRFFNTNTNRVNKPRAVSSR